MTVGTERGEKCPKGTGMMRCTPTREGEWFSGAAPVEGQKETDLEKRSDGRWERVLFPGGMRKELVGGRVEERKKTASLGRRVLERSEKKRNLEYADDERRYEGGAKAARGINVTGDGPHGVTESEGRLTISLRGLLEKKKYQKDPSH